MSTTSRKAPRRRYDNSRRLSDAEARQRRIVEAATALFVEHGFGGTSIDQIAAAASVSPQTIYATFGSKAGVLSRAIDVAVLGDFEDRPLVDRIPVLAEPPSSEHRLHFATAAQFVRALHERVAALMRARLIREIRADCEVWIAQLGPALRPGLTKSRAADVMVTIQSPWIYSIFTVDLGWTPDQYEEWLAHALPHLLLRPELLSE
jgi:AcrR family transcriptional regulator